MGLIWILRVDPVFMKFETHLKIEVRTGIGSFLGILKCNRKGRRVNVMYSLLRYVLSTPKSNSSWLKVDNFKEKASGSVNLGQRFYQTYQRNLRFQGIQWYH